MDGGRGDARRRRRVCSVAARERARGREELGERVRGLGGGAWRRGRGPGRREEAGGGQGEAGGGRGSVGARHASPLFVLLAEEEEDKGEEVGWAGWGAGPGKWCQVGGPGGLLSLSIYFCSVLFCFI